MAKKAFLIVAAGIAAAVLASPAYADRTPSPPGARVYIIWPSNGFVVGSGKFWLRMGARGIGIAPAGVEVPNTGHHHVVIDAPLPPLDKPIPADRNHLHFGAGQTEVRFDLPPGRHTIQLLMGDANHVPHDPPLYSEQITIIVP